MRVSWKQNGVPAGVMASCACMAVRHVVLGAGVVGLAVAARLSKHGTTLVLERNARIGEETSSRNSEVIHAGIYYPPDSLKTSLCIAGRKLLYAVAPKAGIPFRKTTKWIVGTDAAEEAYLQKLQTKCSSLGVHTRFLSTSELAQEPNVIAKVALESPETGIIDSHVLMQWLQGTLENNGGSVVLNTAVCGLTRKSDGLYVVDTDNGPVEAEVVVNSTGLQADRVARLLLGSAFPADYQQYYCKGCYYSYTGKSLVGRLVYPVPLANLAGLGTHATIDLGGRMKLGPDAEYMDDIDYTVNDARVGEFVKAAGRFLRGLDGSRLIPDYAGVRPKLSAQGQPARDFLIQHEAARGYEGFVNLLGIESPGLTSSLAIADKVASLLHLPALSWV
eukprot:TRINITY_DN15369_c0_g1_i1.p1 TRINITY_DN15369_c0_g1~~TRINITY_DN15369_c0_g1_i1.p1  ORF type:complete len:390 (-),score=55.43 TRINITY_DN15369_c0_g1_i1:20-1189(-)